MRNIVEHAPLHVPRSAVSYSHRRAAIALASELLRPYEVHHGLALALTIIATYDQQLQPCLDFEHRQHHSPATLLQPTLAYLVHRSPGKPPALSCQRTDLPLKRVQNARASKTTMVFPVLARRTTESQRPEPADRFLSISRTWHESWMLCRSFARMLEEDDAPTPPLDVHTEGYKQTNNASSRALPSVRTLLPPHGRGADAVVAWGAIRSLVYDSSGLLGSLRAWELSGPSPCSFAAILCIPRLTRQSEQ